MSHCARESPAWSKGRRGFTVVELLVATAITAVLAALLITITNGVMTVWNRSRGSLTTANQVKLALDQLATDLEGAIIRNDGNVWFAATILETNNGSATSTTDQLHDERGWIVRETESSRLKPESNPASSDYDDRNLRLDRPSIDACAFGRAGVWLRFFSTRTASNSDVQSLSAPVAIGYQLCRRRVGTGSDDEIAYMLYRAVVRENRSEGGLPGTFETGYDLSSPAYNTADGSSDGQPGNIVQPYSGQVIASNVVDFGLRLYVREGTTLRLIFPAQATAAGASPLAGRASTSTSTAVTENELTHFVTSSAFDPLDAYRHVKPDVVEVMLRVLTEEGVSRLQAWEAGRIAGSWWDIVEANSRVYTRRIAIQGAPL